MHDYGRAELSDSKGITMNTTRAIAVQLDTATTDALYMARTHARASRSPRIFRSRRLRNRPCHRFDARVTAARARIIASYIHATSVNSRLPSGEKSDVTNMERRRPTLQKSYLAALDADSVSPISHRWHVCHAVVSLQRKTNRSQWKSFQA